ncbi:MAG: helix-turn-helix transcriptional regulator [Gammaproteobacteria bacterium]|nr:helix-turn-helix transcriptional regulator [Gammaproteobacteria bacterium]
MAGKSHFNELMRGLPLISRTLLAQRLRELENAGLITRLPKPNGRGFEYHLTPAGKSVQPIIMQLGEWGRQWLYPAVMKRDLDPFLLMWDIHQRLHTDALPSQRTVIEFELCRIPRSLPPDSRNMKRWWLVVEKPDVELCLTDPGYEVDMVVKADLFALTRVWMGEHKLQDAQREGTITLLGPPALVKVFPGWLKLSMFARKPEHRAVL